MWLDLGIMKAKRMTLSKCCFALLTLAATGLVGAEPVQAPSMRAISGHYYLQGVREVGAELLLSRDGRFEYGISYGGVDQQAQGKWSVQDQTVVLQTDIQSDARFGAISESTEVLAPYNEAGARPVLLVVEIKSSALGLVWSGAEISAEFSNGQVRNGVTGRDGMLGFDVRAEPEWQGLTIKRVGIAYPRRGVAQSWHVIQSPDTRSLSVEFDPGRSLRPAFETLHLKIDYQRKAVQGLTMLPESNPSWRYVRE